MGHDVLLVHPPAIYDFRERPVFYGPVARIIPSQSCAFIMFPIGLVSIAHHLEKNGFNAKILNLAERMLADRDLDVENFIKNCQAKIFGIDLHWCVHAQGALEIAQLYKRYHPSSFVVLGGLTATCFDIEIVSEFPFVDAVLRGEAEDAIIQLARCVDHPQQYATVPNLTYREGNGKVHRNPQSATREDLDELEFARLDLVDPNDLALTASSGSRKMRVWNIPICRGCTFNCATCGGSTHSYRKLMNREKPAFRSPDRILDDFRLLDEQKVDSIFLFQDFRLAGSNYWKRLLAALHKEKWSNIEHVTMELFSPATRSDIRLLSKSKPADRIGLTISPEAGDQAVRMAFGRAYGNEELFHCVETALEYDVSMGVFFMIGLGRETETSIQKTWSIWKKLFEMNVRGKPVIGVDFSPMLLLDPGSAAFDHPDRHGYRLRFRHIREYCDAMQLPSWKQWISYETENLSIDRIAELTLQSWEYLTALRERWRLCDRSVAESERFRIKLERLLVSETDRIMLEKDEARRASRLKELREIAADPLLSYSYVLTEDSM